MAVLQDYPVAYFNGLKRKDNYRFSTYRLDLFYDEIQLVVQLEWVIPGRLLYDCILPKQEWTLQGVTTEMKALQQYVHMVIFFSK